jgi:ABC-2 type transport system permease protein
MRRLLAADRVRFGRRRDLWLLMILVPVVIGLIYLNDFNRTVQGIHEILNVDFGGGTPDPGIIAQIQAQIRQESLAELPAFAFPADLIRIATTPIGVILLALYLSSALVAGEFEWGTVRTIHLTADRAAVLAVRVGVIAGLVVIALGLSLLIGTILPFLMSIDGTPLQQFAVPSPDLGPALGLRLLFILPFIAIPILVSVISRSTGLGFLLTVLVFVVDLAITGTPFWHDSPVPWVPATTITGSISRLLGDESSPLAAVAPGWYSVVALVLWSVLPALAAVALFRRLDLNE